MQQFRVEVDKIMNRKIKGYRYTDILAYVLIPFTLYLFIGLVVINLSGIEVGTVSYIFWGVMAVFAVGAREYAQNAQTAHGQIARVQTAHGITATTVTVGIGIYVAVVTLWFYRYKEGQHKEHIVLAIAGLCVVFLLWKLLRYKWVRVCIGYAALLALIGLELADIHFSKGIIALAIFLFLYSVSETISNINSFIVIYIVAALAVLVLPAPEKPYDWNFVVSAAKSVDEVADVLSVEIEYLFNRWGWDGVFHYGFSGYSDSSMSLSMGVSDRDIEQMTLWGGKTTRNLYLRGNICDTYTGDTWETVIEEGTMDYQTDVLMTLYAIFDYTQDQRELRRFIKVYEREITIQNIKTQSLFYPLKTLRINAEGMQAVGDNLRMAQVLPRGKTYTYTFVDLDYGSEEMIDILTHYQDITYNRVTYNTMFEKMWEYYNIRLEKPPYEEFLLRVEEGQAAVKEQYTVPGDAVSEEVKELADSITADCKNDYEKCRALENYLYQYSYNKSIRMPEDVNALDWFLFDGKEGYCVHYATALAAMLRCERIPARIAEGFLVDYENRVGANRYSISSSSAHAWVEAYLDGIGWIRLEPTVAFAQNAYEKWYSVVEAEEDDEEDEEEEDEEEDEDDEEDEEEDEDEQTEEVQNSEEENGGVSFGILLAGMAATAGIVLWFAFIYRRTRLRKSDNPDVILLYILSIINKRYVPREDGETVREYFRRLSKEERMPEEMSRKLTAIMELMEAYWYGSHVLNEQDIGKLKEVRDELLKKEEKSA